MKRHLLLATCCIMFRPLHSLLARHRSVLRVLEPIRAAHAYLSTADLIVLAGTVALEVQWAG
jgi:catalase (peroxidase I)